MLTADRRRKEPRTVTRPGDKPKPRTGFLDAALAAAGAPRATPAEDEDDGRFDSAPEGEIAASLARQGRSGGGLSTFLAQVTGHSDYRATPSPAAVIPTPVAPELTLTVPVAVPVEPTQDEESPRV